MYVRTGDGGRLGSVGRGIERAGHHGVSETDAAPQDVAEVESDDLEPGTYFIDPDVDPSTPLRVVYEVPAEGWSAWPGAIHFANPLPDHVSVTITTVRNVVRDGCRDHADADPPVGSGVDDLATALAELPPFRVVHEGDDKAALTGLFRRHQWLVQGL